MLACAAMVPTTDVLAGLRHRAALEAAFAFVLFLASSGTVQQYLGLAGVAAYGVGLAAAVPVALRFVLPWFRARVSERTALWLALGTLIALVVAFAVIYPHANARGLTAGSDRDDAANIATRHLFHLEYPYSTPTYLGNVVSQLPGGLLLDAPFVALGNSAYQNVFWLAVLFVALWRYAGEARVALFVSWLALALSPAVLREYLTGGDVIANTCAVLVLMLAVLYAPRRWAWPAALAAIGLGLALSWRPNFIFWMPLLFAALLRRRGVSWAIRHTVLALGSAAAVTLPFYLGHRHGFGPLLTAHKVRRYDDIVPRSGAVVLGATGLLAVGLACRELLRRRDFPWDCALVQICFLGLVIVLASAQARRPDFSFIVIAYGLFFLFPALFAFARALARSA